MRIIAGSLKRRKLHVPKKFAARPMGDRVRSALFNSLLDRLEGASVLDAYGGSGACGLEALSRGAREVLILEKDRSIFSYLQKNVEGLTDEQSVKISRAPNKAFLKNNPEMHFDIIIADPPYELFDSPGMLNDLEFLSKRVKKDGVLVLSWPSREDLPGELGGLKLDRSKTYAGASLGWYV